MTTPHPYYRGAKRSPNRPSAAFRSCGDHIDLSNVHLQAYDPDDAVPKARALFDARAAAAVSAAVAIDGVGDNGPVRVWPPVKWDGSSPKGSTFWERDLLEVKWYDLKAPTIYLPTAKCLAALAYLDFFPERHRIGVGLRSMVSAAILAASPGWCGTFGPGVTGTFSLGDSEGNYDMSQMHLIAIAYQYYDGLSPEAREYLVAQLLAQGRIQRPNCDDTFTSRRAPNDWSRAGYISPLGAHKDIGETENHILMIATARYLTNQLLFPGDRRDDYDNRRNGSGDSPSCMAALLFLLRNILRDDFSEYNAKSYQEETRWALLNLCTYAYDHEVRLAARMVLDYISAHIAVSSSDLRRLVPFRRRNEGNNVLHDPSGFMTLGLLESRPGSDPMTSYFAIQAGNTRAYEPARPWHWGINSDGSRLGMEFLSDYRLPHSIHDLFVNDLHRRFFQRLHRVPRSDEPGGNRNCNNSEIYAGSPSYLITAGGSPSGYAIDPYFAGINVNPSSQRQQLGVAVTTTFMPTGSGDDAGELIQFGAFAEGDSPWQNVGTFLPHHSVQNFGVAPDFACGHNLHLPQWVRQRVDHLGDFMFVNMSPSRGRAHSPGFFLAIHQVGKLALLEAFDTWLHPEVTYPDFMESVLARNPGLRIEELKEFQYTTWNGNRLFVVIWSNVDGDTAGFGAQVLRVEYGTRDPTDAIGDAGTAGPFLAGTVMNSPAEAVVEIGNPFLKTKITLDMSDLWHPRRIGDDGQVEIAGSNHEVWLDFAHPGPGEGDVCRPFNTIGAAVTAVADGGVVRMLPGVTGDRSTIGRGKRLRLVAPISGVVIGASRTARLPGPGSGELVDMVGKMDVWVQFDFPTSGAGHIAGPFNNLTSAAAAVADGSVIRIVPGATSDRSRIGNGKKFRLVAPIGGVTLGWRSGDHWQPHDVWVNFDWPAPGDGTLCSPFHTIGAAAVAVADGGVIRIAPGVTGDRSVIGHKKRFRLEAPSGGARIGAAV